MSGGSLYHVIRGNVGNSFEEIALTVHPRQNVEVDLDRAGIVMPSPPVCSTPRL